MRDTTKSDKIKELGQKENLNIDVLELDVDDENSVKTAIQKILEQKQRIDVLVNNAGWGLWGCVEDVSVDEFKAQFDTNFFSIIRLIQEVGPTMRKQGSRTIVNISFGLFILACKGYVTVHPSGIIIQLNHKTIR